MSRSLLLLSGAMLAPGSWLLLDSAAKGTAFLLLAGAIVLVLRRDSAATRHLVWQVALVALLVMPALSFILPAWRILPQWISVSTVPVSQPTIPDQTSQRFEPIGLPSARRHIGASVDVVAKPPDPASTLTASDSPTMPTKPEKPTTASGVVIPWASAVPLVWSVGVLLLLARLLAARRRLAAIERQSKMLWPAKHVSTAPHDSLIDAFLWAREQLGLQRGVTLLIHPEKSIPIVWGIFRYRLLLPAAARDWKSEQLRSVLLHELAHLKRLDTLSQLFAQLACAIHWFNPLVWFAAWRLSVERERACDDLVLASGVRASQYAGHLLEVISELSPAHWTQACGLAMARKSSLEGRLIAVLSGNGNRRSVSLAVVGAALICAAGFAVPIAMLRAQAQAPAKESPVFTTEKKPQHEYAQTLFQSWRGYARTDGKIPGALLGHVAREIESFVKQHPDDKLSPKLTAIRKTIDATHDWPQADVVSLLDEITAISTAPVSWAHLPLQFDEMGNVKRGTPLPESLKNIDWGPAAANGLRTAWLLEPRVDLYALGSVLKARVLFHNTGKAPVVISIETWRQFDGHKALNAKDEAINVSGTRYTGITPMASYRLAPGDYCEVMGHGLAIGAGKYEEEFSTGAVGAIIEAKEGDDVRLTHTVGTNEGGWTKPGDPKDPAELWKKSIAERVALEGPLPASAADREQLIRRVTRDILGESPSDEEVAAFVGSKGGNALMKLTEKLQAKPRPVPFRGTLTTGETKFRVTAADPDAAKKPRTASAPGRYVLSEHIHLLVSRTTTDSQLTNKGTIAFLSRDPKIASPHKPYEISLPDGLQTWGAVWQRDSQELWVVHKGVVRKIIFADPDNVKEEKFENVIAGKMPQALHDAITKVFQAPGAPVQQQKSLKPREGARLVPAIEKRLAWGKPSGGLRGALIIRNVPGAQKSEDKQDLQLVVQNVSNEPILLVDNTKAPDLRRLIVNMDNRVTAVIADDQPSQSEIMLAPGEVAYFPIFITDSKSATGRPTSTFIADGLWKDAKQSLVAEFNIENAPVGAWKGNLVTGMATATTAAEGQEPKNVAAQALFKIMRQNARGNGDIPGGLIQRLGDKVLEFVRNNSGDLSGNAHAKKMAPLVARFTEGRDRSPAEVSKLLDEVAEAHTIPLEMTAWTLSLERIRTGVPMPKELASAPWGEAEANGLRTAFLLEPRGDEHRLGTDLKAHILIHNSGNNAIFFRTEEWHQFGDHQAHDGEGKQLKVDSTYWTRLSYTVTHRLAPGEFVEIEAAGIGVGGDRPKDDRWQDTRTGAWIHARVGDEVTFQPAAVPLTDWNEEKRSKEGAGWWPTVIHKRLNRELPLPADAQERIRLLDRVTRDLFGNAPSAQESAAFVADDKDFAIESLVKRLAAREGFASFFGELRSAPTRFKVLPADPDAAKKPRTANHPGRYTLGDLVRLEVTRHADGERIVNEGTIHFYSADPKIDAPGKPVDIRLPVGYGTWAVAWVGGETVLWVQDASGLRSYEFQNPADVKEIRIDLNTTPKAAPSAIQDALQAALKASAAP